MIATLLMRLSGPMQAWGTRSRFDHRDTEREPSKSGIIGLLCAALGRSRSEPVDDLASLRMAVRIDQPGRIERDFHTITHERFLLVSGKREKRTVVSDRFYLADAKFLVGLEGGVEMLEVLSEALYNPRWMLFLGRKAFVPGEPVWLPDGLWEGSTLEDTLSSYPWLGNSNTVRQVPEQLRVLVDDPQGNLFRNDVPVDFERRVFIQRRLSVIYVDTPILEEA